MSTVSASTERRRPAAPSLRPALAVVAVAIVIVLGGTVLALVGTSSARQAPPALSGHHIPGTTLRAAAATSFIAHIAYGGEPPSDIVGSLAVPSGSVYLGRAVYDAGVSQFDRQIRIEIPAPLAEVRKFFQAMLSHERWVTNSVTSPSPGTEQILAEKSGAGYQWRVGITMKGEQVFVAPALAGSGRSAAKSTVAIRLYQVEDAS